MSTPVVAVFFDVDGVLLDSLPQHLQICRYKAAEFGLGLHIPTVQEFRELVRQGVKVSPMRYFFIAVGFPEVLADRAVVDYEKEFMKKYAPHPFENADLMLTKLRDAGLRIGLVTSNTQANVVPALGAAMRHFEPSCLFFFDRYPDPKPKSWCLSEGARLLGSAPEQCVYVGDQPADAHAAKDAHTQFLGVTYGWGLSSADRQFKLADSILDIPGTLLQNTA